MSKWLEKALEYVSLCSANSADSVNRQPNHAIHTKNTAQENISLELTRDDFEERAAIMEFDGGLPRQEAEKKAYDNVIWLRFGR